MSKNKQIVSLEVMAEEVSKLYGEGMDLASRATEKMVQLGIVLLRAREQFPGDKEFGQWRAEHTPIKSRQHAHKLMKVAGRFQGNEQAQQLPVSVLYELVTAPDQDVEVLVEKHESGERVTVADAKATKAPPLPFDNEPAAVAPADAPESKEKAPVAPEQPRQVHNWTGRIPDKPQADPMLEKAMNILSLPLPQRCKHYTDAEADPWIVFGISPMFDGMHRREVLDAMLSHLHAEAMESQCWQQLQTAYQEIVDTCYEA